MRVTRPLALLAAATATIALAAALRAPRAPRPDPVAERAAAPPERPAPSGAEPGAAPTPAAIAAPAPRADDSTAASAGAALREVNDPALPPRARATALGVLVGADAALAARAVADLLTQEPDGPLRAAALRALGDAAVASRLGADRAARHALAALATTRDREVALAAGDALERVAPPASELEHALQRTSLPEARVSLVRALARHAGPEARASLTTCARHDPSALVRAEALTALSARADLDPVLLREALADAALAPAAARLLARDPRPEAEQDLGASFRAPGVDDRTGQALARALAARRTDSARALLVDASVAPTEPAATSAVVALAAARDDDAVRAVLARGRSPRARARALEELARRARLAAGELEALATDPEPLVRDAARQRLTPAGAEGG